MGSEMTGMQTIGDRLDAHGQTGPGFDLVRLSLAVMVLCVHSSLLAPGADKAAPLFPGAPIGQWAFDWVPVPAFFALSGFLVAASAERLKLFDFLANRALRIAPALAVQVALAALVLGPLLTTLPLSAYFADPKLWSYLLNLVGLVHYELPGLFASNPEPLVVNGSIWTVPHELFCYALLAALVAVGAFRSRRLLALAVVGLFAVSIMIAETRAHGAALPYGDRLEYLFVTRGAAKLVPMFLLGVVIHRFRHAIAWSGGVAAFAGGALVCLMSFGAPGWAADPVFNAVAGPLLAYLVVWAGLNPAFEVKALKGRDYSYGVYLYGFPLQQAILTAFPHIASKALFFALSLAAAGATAALSWRFVEKPALRLRRGRRSPAEQPVQADGRTGEALPVAASR